MNLYLTIMVTVLVITQMIRITQNAISLHRQKKEIEKNLNWFGEREVTKEDFDCQREVMYLLREKLRGEQDAID